ncbi:MAG: NFACT RNA binding domain-containing protein [Pseudomonadota bacterium]
MSQSYLELQCFVKEYNQSLATVGQQQGWVQKIYSTAHWICLVIRFLGKTRYLYLGRGQGYIGLHEGHTLVPSPLRVKDRYLDYLRAHLVGTEIGQIFIDQQERLIGIPYSNSALNNLLLLFWKGPALYFANAVQLFDESSPYLFCSWDNKKIPISLEFKQNIQGLWQWSVEHFDLIGRNGGLTPKESLNPSSFNLEDYFCQELKKPSSKEPAPQKSGLKQLKRKAQKISDDLKKLHEGQNIRQTIQNPNFQFPENGPWKFGGHTFKLAKSLTHHQKLDLVYQKVKKWKEVEKLQTERLNECQKEIVKASASENSLPQSKIISPIWGKESGKIKPTASHSAHHEHCFLYLWNNSVKIAVGRNVHGNDYLRHHWAHKDDFWFHLENYPSAHAFAKITNKQEITTQFLIAVASLLRDHSKLSIGQIPIIYTQVKNLRAVKGKAGLVTFKKEKHLTLDYQREWPTGMNKIDRD